MSGIPWLDAAALALAALWVFIALGTWRALRVLELPSTGETAAPRERRRDRPEVSIVVPCRNEAAQLETSIPSLLASDYARKEIILVDDRSSDGSRAILERLAAGRSDTEVVAIGDLPDGWLGKCHALREGAARARGDWILFTDADIRHAPSLLGRAVAHAEERGLDLLSVLPDIGTRGLLARSLTAFIYSTSVFALGYWAWTERRQSLIPIGAGAFLLVRRSTYEAYGGHEPLRLAVVDDVSLAMHVRRRGGRTEARFAGRDLVVPLEPSYREFMRLSEKNAFPVLGFRWSLLAGVSIGGTLIHFAAPLLFLAAPGLWPASLVVWAGVAASYLPFARRARAPAWSVVLYPFLQILTVIPMWNSALQTVRRGGVRWRDRHYPLRELKKWRRETARTE